jgi:AcrR family transcriptional regulator
MSTADSTTPAAGGKRERTRAALVQAALEVVAAKGFAAAGLDEIATRAGMTKGAIYSNFSGKADLLLAAMSARGLTLVAAPAPPGETVGEALDRFAGDLADTLARAAGQEAFVAQFQLFALGDPEIRKSLATAYVASYGRMADELSQLRGLAPGVSADRMAVALQSIAMGFLIQSFITPAQVTAEVVHDTLHALAKGLSAE